MTTFTFTSPEGKIYDVNGPEGATQEEAFGMLQQQLQAAPVPPPTPPGASAAPVVPTTPAAQPQTPDEFLGGLIQEGLPKLGHYAGLGARALLTGRTGLAGMLADAPVAATNWVTEHFGKEPYELPSQKLQKVFGSTLGEPQNMTEKVLLGLGSLAAGSKDPLANALRARYAQPLPPTPEFNKTMKAAQQLGYKSTPEQSGSNLLARGVQSFAGGQHMTRQASAKNQVITDRAFREELGVPKTFGLTRENIKGEIDRTYQAGYEPLKAFGPVTVGSVYRDALNKVNKDFAGVSANDPEGIAPAITKLVEQNLNRKWTAEEMVNRISLLRKNASDAFDNDNTALAQANRSIAAALEKALEMNLKASPRPEDLQKLVNYREARTLLAKQHAAYDAIIPGSGSGNAAALAKQLRQDVPLSGAFKTIGEFAATRPELTAYPKRQPSIFTNLERAALGAGAGTAMTGNLPVAAKFLAYPAVSVPTRAAMLTAPFQSAFVNPKGAPLNFRQVLEKYPQFLNAMPTGFQLGTGLFGQE